MKIWESGVLSSAFSGCDGGCGGCNGGCEGELTPQSAGAGHAEHGCSARGIG